MVVGEGVLEWMLRMEIGTDRQKSGVVGVGVEGRQVGWVGR